PAPARRAPGASRTCRVIPRGLPRSASPAPCSAFPSVIRDARAIRNSRTWTGAAPGRPPRRESRRRRARAPAGILFRQNALPRELSRGALEDLILHLKLPVLAAQLGQLLFLRAGQLYGAAVLVGVGLGHPVPQARLADAQVLGDLGHRCGALAGQL